MAKRYETTALFEDGAAVATDPPAAGYAHVALEQNIDVAPAGLTYGVPETLADVQVGERVRVPLGAKNRPVAGYVIERYDTCDLTDRQPKLILERDRRGLSLPSDLIALARWIASYYCAPTGMVLATMLPAAVKRGTGSVSRTEVGLPEGAEGSRGQGAEGEKRAKVTKLQRAVLDAAQQRAAAGHAWTEIKQLADLAGARSVSSVKQLVEKGALVARRTETVVSDLDVRAQRVAEPVQSITLNAGQQQALDHLLAHLDGGFGAHLVHGVTGSGKTEVYLRVLEKVLKGPRGQGAEGPSEKTDGGEAADSAHSAPRPLGPSAPSSLPPGAIVLVPEIALTPQTVGRFHGRFDHVAVLHSGLTAAQRHAQWRRIRSGEANIVVGARSAVFAPVPNLKLIIVDEEHESSYKQDQLPRYHARDVAIKRAQLCHIPVVLGSATPSLESYFNAGGVSSSRFQVSSSQSGADNENLKPETWNLKPRSAFHYISMPERVGAMKMPTVELVDLQEERRARRGIHLLSQRLEQALHLTLDEKGPGEKGQAMLLLNRRGYANYIACPDHRCGWLMRCDQCDVTLVYHKDDKLPTGGVVRCHHCEAEQLLPKLCPHCSKAVTTFGLGTQRVEEEMQRKFPNARVRRMDRDTMRSGRDYQATLDAFRAGEIDVLLGTQMIAKGLDFPRVRLVGVISADTSLNMPDFRASERTFQLIAQVSGRAGRSEHPGRVIVQSFNIEDAAIQAAARHDYAGFAERELGFRAQVGLPPITRMARIVVRDRDHVTCTERAQVLAAALHESNEAQGHAVRVRGPVPCPIARIAGFHRQQIELIAPDAAKLQRLLTTARNARALGSDAHTAVDVDPVALL
ncbi:MAG: replication restart helicase PriA [Phycisphaeraceae bacterium]